jgi:hypothetical protein
LSQRWKPHSTQKYIKTEFKTIGAYLINARRETTMEVGATESGGPVQWSVLMAAGYTGICNPDLVPALRLHCKPAAKILKKKIEVGTEKDQPKKWRTNCQIIIMATHER